ncbi:DMT family transporter [uncultured Desulfobacter sp.]|uniref:DMT family transporter n=1 Tax=uncultured Desulfobacter sp. TaxID=240139 RepID=UPI0029C6CEEC|nr:DMT family transporter [uncultured Desulfobacter sp.]
MMFQNTKLKTEGAYILLILTTFFWGITFVVVKDAVNQVDVFVFLAQRFIAASFILLLLWPFLKRRVDWKTLLRGSVLGVMLFGGFALQTLALLYTSASNTAFLTGLNVIFVPLLYAVIFRKAIAAKSLAGAALAFIGLYLLCASGTSWSFNKGDLLGFACSICIAIHIIYTGKYARECDIYWLTTIQLGVIGLMSLLIAYVTGHDALAWYPEIRNALIICVLFATIFAFLVQTGMQQFISPSSTALIFCLEPVFAAICAYFLIDENIGITGLIGAVLILLGMILSEIKLKRR